MIREQWRQGSLDSQEQSLEMGHISLGRSRGYSFHLLLLLFLPLLQSLQLGEFRLWKILMEPHPFVWHHLSSAPQTSFPPDTGQYVFHSQTWPQAQLQLWALMLVAHELSLSYTSSRAHLVHSCMEIK